MIICGIRKMINGFFLGIFNMFMEVVKFGMVLILTYMLGLGIFYVWERSISPSAEKILLSPRTSLKEESPRGSLIKPYPHVVEMPLKRSKDSFSSMSNEIKEEAAIVAEAIHRLSENSAKDSADDEEPDSRK